MCHCRATARLLRRRIIPMDVTRPTSSRFNPPSWHLLFGSRSTKPLTKNAIRYVALLRWINERQLFCISMVFLLLFVNEIGGIHLCEARRRFLEGSLHPANVLMCPHTCVTNLPKPRELHHGNFRAHAIFCFVVLRLTLGPAIVRYLVIVSALCQTATEMNREVYFCFWKFDHRRISDNAMIFVSHWIVQCNQTDIDT